MQKEYPQLGEKDTYWTRNCRELAECLSSISPSIAELYQGAVELLFDRPVPRFSRFVSHAVREIHNRLPQEVSGLTSAGRLDCKSRMDELVPLWRGASVFVDGMLPATGTEDGSVGATGILVPKRVARKIAALVDDHERARERPRDAAMRLFESVAPRNQQYRDSVRPVILQWMEVGNWFLVYGTDARVRQPGCGLRPRRISQKFRAF
jgi:hypothetical protein